MITEAEVVLDELMAAVARGEAQLAEIDRQREDERRRKQAQVLDAWLALECEIHQALPELLRPFMQPIDVYSLVDYLPNSNSYIVQIVIPQLAPIRIKVARQFADNQWAIESHRSRHNNARLGLFEIPGVAPEWDGEPPHFDPDWDCQHVDNMEVALALAKRRKQELDQALADFDARREAARQVAAQAIVYEPVDLTRVPSLAEQLVQLIQQIAAGPEELDR